ncbi:hypothetical protein NOF55_05200 [Rhizobiaceae bacterium BDR2-2]|uniref:Uncharacterized protein n=1 Tax=Ectorhizobium quercum TaxID=2965071 RepID=A0AAE3MWD5_9HYPH|nr:hypothetical protein [Ectorhizobium quercum]MCX8996498.1 hypothetical protein [Ectorhizobium quercum]
MTAKLHINISQGIIDVEGDPELVQAIYADFKEQLLESVKGVASAPAASVQEPVSSENGDAASGAANKPKAKRRAAAKKKANGDEGGSGVVADSPKLDKNLDTSGLGTFYGKYVPKNNAEKILIFLKFMTEDLKISNPNTDQVYTCFKATGEKIPKAFAQAFYDTSSKLGYIDFRSSTDMPITIAGDNHFNHTLKKKGAE